MTMPVLIANTKKTEYSNKLKKVYSVISQAILLSEAQTGTSSLDWERTGMINNDDGTSNNEANDNEVYNFYMNYLNSNLKSTKVEKGGEIEIDGETRYVGTKVYLADGTILSFTNGACFDIVADLNGKRIPNEEGRDIYRFLLCPRNWAQGYFGNKNQSFGPYTPTNCPTREIALQRCKDLSAYCSTLLMYDNWEYKNDYPYKL